jgi:hypothetical protein
VGRAVEFLALLAVAATSPSLAAAPQAPAPDRARETVFAAMAASEDIPGQALSLVKLAWPAGKRDELVAARARQELENFGDHAMMALREAINSVKIGYTEEVVITTLGAQRKARVEMAGTHLPVIMDALWVGSREAKSRAIHALADTHSPFAVQPMIDCAVDDPALAAAAVETLGAMRYPQARFYLEKVMMEGPPSIRPVAAASLAQIGGSAIVPLRNALKSGSRDSRLLAARTIIAVATEYDLGALYEYIEKHGDDDPGLTQALKASTGNIEKAIAARDANAAAGSPKNF